MTIRKRIIRRRPGFSIVFGRTAPKKWWDEIPFLKEVVILIFGAMISFGTSVYTTKRDKSEQYQKDFREKRDNYTNEYIKQLNQKFYLLNNFVEEDSSPRSIGTNNYLQKIHDLKLSWKMNFKYDSVQFQRFFGDRYNNSLNEINDLINYKIKSIEGDVKKRRLENEQYKFDQTNQMFNIYQHIDAFETSIYKEIDKD